MKIKWTLCRTAEADHKHDKRQYAHTYHYSGTICTCAALWRLPKKHRDAILLHEIGHLLAGPKGSEADADRCIRKIANIDIYYTDSTYYGDELQTI